MRNVLLVWQCIPESIKLYLLRDLSKLDYDMLVALHDKYVNVVNGMTDDEYAFLNSHIEFKTPEYDSEVKDSPPLLLATHATIVVSGFLM